MKLHGVSGLAGHTPRQTFLLKGEQTMNRRILILAGLCCLATASLLFAEGLLRDSDFSIAGCPDSSWQLAVDKGGQAEPATAADGKTPALHVKAAALTQQVTLPEGLFELTVEARGQGELLLSVSGAGERSQMLGKDWGTYGYLFQTEAGERTVTIRVAVDGTLTSAAIRPATDEQKAGWALQQKSIEQFGFITVSAQRPLPGSAALQFAGNVKPLDAMTKFAVLDEPRLNTSDAEHVDRLVHWLGRQRLRTARRPETAGVDGRTHQGRGRLRQRGGIAARGLARRAFRWPG